MDIKEFDDAILDYNECIRTMSVDGEYENGLGRYPEYPDAFVGSRNNILLLILTHINRI